MLYCYGSNLEAFTARVDGQGRGRVAGKERRAFFFCFAKPSSGQNQQHLGNFKIFTLIYSIVFKTQLLCGSGSSEF
jgi:hypothetical protein